MKRTTKLHAAVSLLIGWSALAQAVPTVQDIHLFFAGGQPVELSYPSTPDPSHSMELSFTGSAIPFGPGGPLRLWFDWIGLDGQPQVSDTFTFNISLMDVTMEAHWTVPFCPEQVSIHFEADPLEFYAAEITGQFTYDCLEVGPPSVPEGGSSFATFVISLTALALMRRRLPGA